MTEYHGPVLNTPADTRVRFCPSPTGTPHVGMVRTALFNWAYARHTGGKLVFRIEDTDAARDSEESFNQVLESLHWLGINWDEGVGVGGPHEPYRQSERKTAGIYNEIFQKLVEGGYVYEDFSTPDEVKERRKAAGQDPQLGYDNYDRNLTEEQKEAYRAEGRKPVWRLRMPDEDITFNDLVRGEITFKAGTVPDYVVVLSNGDPLYPFVNPVDDALMGITHVLRGEDLLSSTPRQIALYRALYAIGVARYMPVFGHLPYVMGEGNKKLSKRDPQANLFLHRDNGFIPEGLLNYLGLLGWSLSADEDIFTPQQFVEHFDVHKVLANPARFDEKKAIAINGTHVRMLDVADFRDRLVPYLHAAVLVGEHLTEREMQILTAAAPLVQERVQLLGEAVEMLAFLFTADRDVRTAEGALKGMPADLGAAVAAAREALAALPEDEFTTERIEAALRAALIDGLGLKPRQAFGPVRVAVTGRKVSPPLFESLEILGRDSALARLDRVAAEQGLDEDQPTDA